MTGSSGSRTASSVNASQSREDRPTPPCAGSGHECASSRTDRPLPPRPRGPPAAARPKNVRRGMSSVVVTPRSLRAPRRHVGSASAWIPASLMGRSQARRPGSIPSPSHARRCATGGLPVGPAPRVRSPESIGSVCGPRFRARHHRAPRPSRVPPLGERRGSDSRRLPVGPLDPFGRIRPAVASITQPLSCQHFGGVDLRRAGGRCGERRSSPCSATSSGRATGCARRRASARARVGRLAAPAADDDALDPASGSGRLDEARCRPRAFLAARNRTKAAERVLSGWRPRRLVLLRQRKQGQGVAWLGRSSGVRR